tara:strand:- start:1053 stop:1529 length:477 start_codon:yes stop_codon:yes gene_type:complete
MWYVLAAVFGVLYATLLEWLLHKYILHGLGKNKKSYWAFHWHSHHKTCRKNKNSDINYKFPGGPPVKKEIISLLLLTIIHIPLWYVSKIFYLTLVLCAIRYFYMHRKSHLNIEWGRKKMPWHHDHHMGTNQDTNWGVTTDLMDLLMNTRVYYLPRRKD